MVLKQTGYYWHAFVNANRIQESQRNASLSCLKQVFRGVSHRILLEITVELNVHIKADERIQTVYHEQLNVMLLCR